MTLRIVGSVLVFVAFGGMGLLWMFVGLRVREPGATFVVLMGVARIASAGAIVLSIWFAKWWAAVAFAGIGAEFVLRLAARRRLD